MLQDCLLTVIFLCCCFRFRIPRTKQEIEADYVRKKITRKFQTQLKLIQNSEMDEMDLKKGIILCSFYSLLLLNKYLSNYRGDTLVN